MLRVQEFLRAHPPEALTEQFAVSVKRHPEFPSLVMLKYSQIASPMAEPLVQECRGLILDEARDWAPVCWGLHKFFNAGEVHAAEIDWETARVYEKLDGSLMQLYWHEGEWRVASSGLPDAGGPVGGGWDGTFAELFWQTWRDLGYRLPHPKHITFCFELMTAHNRIVVRHEKPRLVLHSARSRATGLEGDPECYARDHGWECVRRFPFGSLGVITDAANAANPLECEGFVVCDAHFRRVKVKGARYVALAHLRDSLGASRRNLLEIARSNEQAELLAYFPEFQAEIDGMAESLRCLNVRITETYESLRAILEQKGFALEAVRHPFSWVLFELRKGKAETSAELLRGVPIEKLERVMETAGVWASEENA